MNRVLYPGSFNPITNGHMNIVEQASTLFDEVIIAVLHNPTKTNNLFNLSERLEMIKEIYKDYDNIKVIASDKAAVDVAEEYDCVAIVRGLRGLSDYDYEVQLSQINKKLSNGKVNTVCLFADAKYQFISSTLVRELFGLEKDISDYVNPIVKNKMLQKRR